MSRLLAAIALVSLFAWRVDPAWAGDGAEVYSQNCMMCHQSGGTGLPGQFPRLAGRVGTMAAAAEGRAYLIDVLSFGLSASITVDGQPIIGFMPSFQAMSDEDVAAVLSYVSGLGSKSPKTFTADEVKKQKQSHPDSSTPDTAAVRKQLQGKKVVPP
jgi:mono/diheme cytochrome c family protein